jgi:hypothetical protein
MQTLPANWEFRKELCNFSIFDKINKEISVLKQNGWSLPTRKKM